MTGSWYGQYQIKIYCKYQKYFESSHLISHNYLSRQYYPYKISVIVSIAMTVNTGHARPLLPAEKQP
jgi:hypothetical protein